MKESQCKMLNNDVKTLHTGWHLTRTEFWANLVKFLGALSGALLRKVTGEVKHLNNLLKVL